MLIKIEVHYIHQPRLTSIIITTLGVINLVNITTVKPPYDKHAQKQVLLLLYEVKLVRK